MTRLNDTTPDGDYYSRTSGRASDGSPTFATAQDRANEQEVARIIERAFNCSLHRFGELSAVDWWGVRHERPVAVFELKSRTHASDKYPTVFLNVRKWLALHLLSAGMGVPAFYVVRFTDQIRWIALAHVPTGIVRVGGTNGIVKARSDVEPMFDVPVSSMTRMEANDADAA